MNLIKSIEVAYFRSIHKEKIDRLDDMTILFGRNDSGKSNFLRALNLFFRGETNPGQEFSFARDFNTARLSEAEKRKGTRKFVYIKIEFNTPPNWQASLGKSFYVKKSWSITRGVESKLDTSIKDSKKQFLTRFLNNIEFHYIPAIKDRSIFEHLLSKVYNVLSKHDDFSSSLSGFTKELQAKTKDISEGLLAEIGIASSIAPPDDLTDLFRSLDFETKDSRGNPYSLTLQRGDGVQVRHIPQILAFLSDNSDKDYHLWGFEEPENSLELANAVNEAQLLSSLSNSKNKQLFVTSHSPAFFSLDGHHVKRFYISKKSDGQSEEASSAKQIKANDLPGDLMGETPLLPAISHYLKEAQHNLKLLEEAKVALEVDLESGNKPVLFVEGESDKIIFEKAWRVYCQEDLPFNIIDAKGTSKMKSLAQDGRVLSSLGNERKIFVLVDHDKEGRDLSKSAGRKRLGAGGTWIQHSSNKSYWCLLPFTDDFKESMKGLGILECSWPFTIENCFSQDVHAEAIKAGVLQFDELPHDELINCDISKKIAIPLAQSDEHTYLRAPSGDNKLCFANWLSDLPSDRNDLFLPFKPIIEGLCEYTSKGDQPFATVVV